MGKGRSVGALRVDLSLGTLEFFGDLDKSNAGLTDFANKAKRSFDQVGSHGVSSMQATSGAIRLLEGNPGIRATERFLATTLNLGPALQAAFPLIGAIAFGSMLVKIGEETYDFFKKIQEAPSRVNAAFRELNAPLRITNDELRVTADRLEMQIAKLEGHRQNTLKLALDEARLAADKLAQSLEKDLTALGKLLKEEDVGFFRRMMGEKGTKSLQIEQFGEDKFAGHGGFQGKIEDINDRGQNALDRATDQKSKKAAQDQLDGELRYAYDARIKELKDRGQANADARAEAIRQSKLPGRKLVPAQIPDTVTDDIGIRESIRFLREQRNMVGNNRNVTQLKEKKEALEAGAANAKPGDLIAARMQAMRDQLGEVQAKLQSVGQTDAFRAQTEGVAAAIKAIDQLNKELKEYKASLTDKQQAEITDIAVKTKQAEVETAYQTKLFATDRETANRITSLHLMAAAIGEGYEATKKANIETQLMSKFGASYSDPARASDVEEQRQGMQAVYDKEHANQVAGAVDKLGDQIKLETSLAAVQSQGAEAVRLVTLAYRLREIAIKGGNEATRDLIKSEIDLYNAQRANLNAEELSKLTDKLAAVKSIAAAEFQGAEAVRKATLNAKYVDLKKTLGPSPQATAVIQATKGVDEAEHQAKVTTEAIKSANVYREQLRVINEQIKALRALAGTEADQVGLVLKLRDLENDRLHIMVEQAMKIGTLTDGYKAFFTQIALEAEKPGKILYDSLNHAVDGVSSSLTKAMTGQKASWGEMFKGIGEQMLQATVKSGIQKGVGWAGKKLGLDLGMTKLDGQTESTAPWVRIARAGVTNGDQSADELGRIEARLAAPVHVWLDNPQSSSSDSSNVSAATGQGFSLGGLFGGAGGAAGLLGGLFSGGGGAAATGAESVTSAISFGGPFMGSGGFAPAGTAYAVGDNGLEMRIAGPRGDSIIPMDQLGGGNQVHNHYYDNRNADIGVAGRFQQMQAQTEQRATQTAILAQHERSLRTPSGSH